jgi:hypothetical protein
VHSRKGGPPSSAPIAGSPETETQAGFASGGSEATGGPRKGRPYDELPRYCTLCSLQLY